MKQHCVYRFLNKNSDIIYIGRTSDGIKNRINGHFSKGHLPSECYDEVAKIEYCTYPTKAETMILEIYLINLHKPIYNSEYKEYKDLTFEIHIELDWIVHDFKTKEERKKNELQETINKLREEILQNKEEMRTLRERVGDYFQKNAELKEVVSSQYKNLNSSKRPKVNNDISFDSDKIEFLYKHDDFKDVEFVGELKVNDNVIERINVKREEYTTVFYFDIAMKALHKEYLLKNLLNLSSDYFNFSIIDSGGFSPITEDFGLCQRMKEYCEFHKYKQFT